MVFNLKGKMVVLRRLKKSDLNQLLDVGNNKLICKYMRFNYPFTQKQAKELINSSRKHNQYVLGIELKEINQIIGVITLRRINLKNKNAEITIWTGKKYWKNGYSFEALNLLIRFAFYDLKLVKLWANVDSDNVASKTGIIKAGFKQEGYLVKQIYYKNKWIDQLRFALLK